MLILHFISHTHWDREWYEPFQIFRIRLAQTIDKALDILASDPDYKYFMLDGQTIVLEDYIEIRPEREDELRAHIRTGRILIGPWYILPDEFLVSGEAIIRNLQRGIRIANSYGRSMMIGYIPDPFGHIGQMPQILAGFGIRHAMFRRGLADEPTELWWEGADGTRMLTTYLRDGYDNAAWLSREPELFAQGMKRLVESLAPHAVTENLLMMHGTDHMPPWENLPKVMRQAAALVPGVSLTHSNLPKYAETVERSLTSSNDALSVVKGELRNPKRHHLLPGVTSSRMWIKQRNARAQVLLERWAEPLAAVAANIAPRNGSIPANMRPELHLAWKYLLQNHPHDSICGCSADQVHSEMAPRFDSVQQIGENVVGRALASIIREIDTRREGGDALPIVVFNPTPGPRSDVVRLQVDLTPAMLEYQVIDDRGVPLPSAEATRQENEYARVTATADDLRWMFGGMKSGQVDGRNLREMRFQAKNSEVNLDIVVSDQGDPHPEEMVSSLAELDRHVADPGIRTFHVRVLSREKADLQFVARDLPGCGYRTFWLVNRTSGRLPPQPSLPKNSIENEFLRIDGDSKDGTLKLTDKTTGMTFSGIHRFVDEGDCGDLYNYCAPEHDQGKMPVSSPAIDLTENNSLRQTLRIKYTLQVPSSLSPDRRSRSPNTVDIPVETEVSVFAGSRRVDFQTQVDNTATDHRLRVEFPAPFRTDKSIAGQAFDLISRDLGLPPSTSDWVEKPVPTKPMQDFVAIDDGKNGLMLAARGLPEYEIRQEAPESIDGLDENRRSTIALTLLRCVGWLSRPDLSCRRGDAGPEKRTPGAQEQGIHVFHYSLIPYGVNPGSNTEQGGGRVFDLTSACSEALAFTAPLRAVPTETHPGTIPSTSRWIQVSSPEFMLSAIKQPEEGDGLIVRGFNSSDATITTRLRPLQRFAHASRVSLNEEEILPLDLDDSRGIELAVKPREIVTIRFRN